MAITAIHEITGWNRFLLEYSFFRSGTVWLPLIGENFGFALSAAASQNNT